MGEAARVVCAIVERAGLSSRMADCHELRQGDTLLGMVMTFEKYYLRAGGRLTMTVVLDGLEEGTRAYWVVTGGGGMLSQNGDSKVAGEKYAHTLEEALLPYLRN